MAAASDLLSTELRYRDESGEYVDTTRHVWDGWTPQPSKTKLAVALWPALRHRIDLAMRGEADAPAIAAVVHQAHQKPATLVAPTSFSR